MDEEQTAMKMIFVWAWAEQDSGLGSADSMTLVYLSLTQISGLQLSPKKKSLFFPSSTVWKPPGRRARSAERSQLGPTQRPGFLRLSPGVGWRLQVGTDDLKVQSEQINPVIE